MHYGAFFAAVNLARQVAAMQSRQQKPDRHGYVDESSGKSHSFRAKLSIG